MSEEYKPRTTTTQRMILFLWIAVLAMQLYAHFEKQELQRRIHEIELRAEEVKRICSGNFDVPPPGK